MFTEAIFKYSGFIWRFIKQHPDILYSLALVVLIPFALYLNLNFAINSFQKNIDATLQTKAFLVEKIFDVFLMNSTSTTSTIDNIVLEDKVKKITRQNPEIIFLTIKKSNGNKNALEIIASSTQDNIINPQDSKKSLETAELLSWQNDEAIGFLSATENNQRQWNVVKPLHNNQGEKTGLIQLALSLKTTDDLVGQTIERSYIILIIAIILVLALIINHTHLFEYAVLSRRLMEVNRMKDGFISLMAHELRSPLALIKGYAQLLDSEKSKDVVKDLDKKIISSVDRLDNLIEDILEVSRIEQGRLSFELKEISPVELIKEVIGEFKSKIEAKGLKIYFKEHQNGSQGKYIISADSNRFKQVLINLLSNAVKYTLVGEIEIDAFFSDIKNKYYISIRDTGLGMSAEAQKRLFEKFYRIKDPRAGDVVGTGLGLWITKALCEKMNGEIFVESIDGIGSKFTITFPLTKKY